MEVDGDSPRLWSPPPTTLLIPVRRRGRLRTSPILNPEALILAIPIFVLLIIFLVLPPFLSYTNHQILKPGSVQKGWDSVNIFLVLIAVLCGVFAKRNEDSSSSSLDADGGKEDSDSVADENIRKSIASSKWLDFPDKWEYDRMTSSRSYPDLRQESLWGCESDVFKCFDDFEVDFHRQPEKLHHRERRSRKVEAEAVAAPALSVRRRRSVHKDRNENERNENKSPPPSAPSLPPPPPSPPPLPEPEFRSVAEKSERVPSNKEIATVIASLQYGTQAQRKKKAKTRAIYESATEDSLTPSVLAQPSTPPPPPPPPPSQGIQSLLKKSNKSKQVHSVPTTAQPPPLPPPPPPNSIFASIFKAASKSKRSQLSSASSQPPPPPPPPPYSIFNNIFSSGSKSKRCQIPSASSHPPPPPPPSSIIPFENLTKNRRFKNSDTPIPPLPPSGIRLVYTGKPPKPPKPNTSSHNETHIIVPPSPLILMPPPPPPPPPPPFITPEMDRKRSQKLEYANVESDGGESIRALVSCPSPDVNTKADTFISRLKDGWRLEKMNSINERQNPVSTSNRL